MTGARPNLARDCRGNAAVELALIMPILLMLMFGSAELGNYFMNEHGLVKAVRDGARFGARQDFLTSYPDCSTVSQPAQDKIKNIVMQGYLSGGTTLTTPNITAADITVETSCAATVAGENMVGIYDGHASGAQIVRVIASVPYTPIVGAFGFTGLGYTVGAQSEAAVTGE